jgi:hypothetical protein
VYNISFTEERKDLKERYEKENNKEVKEREGGR